MDGSTDVKTFDDGLYHPHPPTKSSATPSPSTDTDPGAATIVSAASFDSVDDDTPASTPVSQGSHPAKKAKHSPGTAIPQESFSAPPVSVNSSIPVNSTAPISSILPVATSVTLPNRSMEVEPPRLRHNSTRAVVTSLLSVSGVLVLVLITAYLTSQRFRRWRESRRARHMETKWKISRPLQEDGSPRSSMRELPQVQVPTHQLVYGPPDPFARSAPRHSRMPFNIGRSDPVEEIDEERGWLWGTQTSKNSKRDRHVTPGLGTGRYRSKNGRGRHQTSLNSHSTYTQPEDLDEMKEELLYDDEAQHGGAYQYEYTDDQGELANQDNPSSGVSHLFGRIKQSIGSRSGFGSLGSSTGRLRIDSSRGQWNEVGQQVLEDEKDITAQDEHDDEKTAGLQVRFDSNISSRSAPLLSDIVLPELPAFTWDDHSGLKVAKTKRARAPSLEVEIDDGRADYVPGDSHAIHQPSSCPRIPPVNSVRQIVSRLEDNEGKYTHLPSPSSRDSRRQRKQALPSSNHNIHQADKFTHLPSPTSSRTRTGKSHTGLVKTKSKHLYPGGYLGRSPTKKLRRKESPES
ncbi:hypothetical protein PSTG_12705 [Puccinia striiformis f. sp. tritici PST-78]|uniref:Uncharacterized protein n=1 Tax=Puccinia striiformis f. sp. tritici PST-78 TaxID=1165861 RepID=A0A0L0V3P5_9BASI|nr:hypothetical protein PSTG_12705 [Puccinia striiformis f. sp. tritici PST-78]